MSRTCPDVGTLVLYHLVGFEATTTLAVGDWEKYCWGFKSYDAEAKEGDGRRNPLHDAVRHWDRGLLLSTVQGNPTRARRRCEYLSYGDMSREMTYVTLGTILFPALVPNLDPCIFLLSSPPHAYSAKQ